MDDKEIENFVDELFREIDGKISKDELRKLFKLWLSYNYPPETVKQKILQKYKPGRMMKIGELKDEIRNINIIGKVISIKISEKGGRKIYSGIIGDETGTIPFTISRELNISKGDVIKITNAYTGYFNNVLRLYLQQNSDVEKMENYDIGQIQIMPSKYTLDKINKNSKNVEVNVKILQATKKENNGRIRISGVLADETGVMPFTAWNKEIEEGKSYNIKGAYAREFRDKLYLTIGENTEVKEIEGINLEEKVITISSAIQKGLSVGWFDGIFLDVSEDTGLIARCPICGKILKGSECPDHGKVTPKQDILGKATFDDGTLSGKVIFSRSNMELLLGKSFDEIVKMVISSPGIPVLKENLEDKILLKPFRIMAKISMKEQNFINITPIKMRMLGRDDLKTLKEKLLEMI
ncbi:MAG: hypothetical protein QXU94_00885 [Thermoplasmata archaeon]